ncbi:50S ribosomal protein L3 N(5)-glutamine methyltransferase [Suttonella sp. R2A3]|uniref:50S ribosomal protein L3 N(5)-glutamine methyltransferase n=1 Tax=Suttonella sp. R2A3 TaxID=2908648 RepID=UPI001F30CA2E|nr:50S ribosomal protein L3 N(5)-glutamine methyltransferase [Suttonella sp. R2A3]UJF24505.1 50S ribosomal protein L3 N(5)-glutamine methyltransferase [Suttonella sp. R2A3]
MQELRTLLDWLRYSASELARHDVYFGHGTDSPLDEAAALVLGMLSLPYDLSMDYFHARVTEQEAAMLAGALQRRIHERVPVPYITQRTLYGGYDFYVDERVLIPRSPIAELIEEKLAPWWPAEQAPERVLDLCCGSGCIGILAKMAHPEAEVVLADIDEDALAVAEINIDRFGMRDCGIETLQSDGFSQVQGQFDWILCNPPYVEAPEMDEIAPEFTHEPLHALISGEDGLNLTQQLLAQAADYLTPEGVLILEVGMTDYLLEEAYPELDFSWIEFTRGGQGVCAISADELMAWREAGLV